MATKHWPWVLIISHLCLASSSHADIYSARSRRAGFLERPRVSYSALHQMHSTVKSSINWSIQNRIPPWLSNIETGSSQGVALVLGQSLKPDGNPPQVLLDRALKAKELLDTQKVSKVIVSGSDPAGVGHTEAWEMKQVLVKAGIPADVILMESQATTTMENAWFSLRWIPKGTGHFYIVTSDFHIARATYIFEEVFNYFYRTWEDRYKDDIRWKNPEKKYPRLELHQVAVPSFCGRNESVARDHDPHADINQYSLRKRALDELGFMGSGEVCNALYGQPLDNNQIWPVQINVTLDPENEANFNKALAQSMNTAEALCRCVSPPEPDQAAEIRYPLRLPASRDFPTEFPGAKYWEDIRTKCE